MFSHKVNTLTLRSPDFPLKNIPSPPEKLFYMGAAPQEWLTTPKLAVVGSRKVSPYGRTVTSALSAELTRAGVVIISGLAYGVDSLAHQAAITAGEVTVAVLPSGLDNIYPAAHYNLACRIVETGGTLLSEYPPGTRAFKTNFIARNRLVSGLADGLLITEATINSGTLHTARFALEQGKTVMAVPGNITSPTSVGCNNLIKSGAVPVTDVSDIFFALNIAPTVKTAPSFRGKPEEEKLFKLISQGVSSHEELALMTKFDAANMSSALTALELAGAIRPLGAGRWVTG